MFQYLRNLQRNRKSKSSEGRNVEDEYGCNGYNRKRNDRDPPNPRPKESPEEVHITVDGNEAFNTTDGRIPKERTKGSLCI
jgi:hypothetical protein